MKAYIYNSDRASNKNFDSLQESVSMLKTYCFGGGKKAILQQVLTRKLRIVGNSRMERVHTGSQWLFSSSNREGFTEATASWGRDIKQD